MADNGKNVKKSSPREMVGLDRKLLAYALAGGAALVAPTQADIISYAGPTLSTLSGPINLDLNGDSIVDFSFSAVSGMNVSNSVDPNGVLNGVRPTPVAEDASVASGGMNFESVTVLNSVKVSYGTLFNVNNTFPNGADSYLGLVFQISGLQHYGWALVNPAYMATGAFSGEAETQVKAFAYQTVAGADILAGETAPIPEPSTMALLALGSVGLAIARRRRTAQA